MGFRKTNQLRTGISASAMRSDPATANMTVERHRLEHLSFDAAEEEDGNVHEKDDQDAEEDRSRDFRAGLADRAPASSPGSRLRRQPPEDVFHHDDRAVHDQAEVDGAETHQVARDAEPVPCR